MRLKSGIKLPVLLHVLKSGWSLQLGLGWVKMSPHQNICKLNSCSQCSQNGCRKIPQTSPAGAPRTNSYFCTLPIWGQCGLEKGGACVSQPRPPRPALSKQESWGRPFLHGGPEVGFSKEMKSCLVWTAKAGPASAFRDLICVDFLAISSLWSHREGRVEPVNSSLHQRGSGKEGQIGD